MMAIRDFRVGAPNPVAADLNTFLIQQQHVVKPSDESVTSSTTLQNDDHLVLPVTANTLYFVQGMLIYTGNTSGDMQFQWTGPSGATFDWASDALPSGATTTTDQVSRTALTFANVAPVAAITGSTATVPFKGVLSVGSSGGSFRIKWGQFASNATATVMKAGSYIMTRRCI